MQISTSRIASYYRNYNYGITAVAAPTGANTFLPPRTE